MDWTMNDGLYNRFIKWQLKCENILDCKLVVLPEARKCKKVVAWNGDFCLGQYISWNLSSKELTLEVLWERFEEFCKAWSNEVGARFDLLTSFRQDNRSVNEWYNAVQTQIALAKYSQEAAKILHRDIFCFFLNDEDFVSRTINVSNIDSNKFLASKVCQLAKKMVSSKATTKHIKPVASDPQAVQVNLLWHQHTEITPSKSNQINRTFKFRQGANKFDEYKPRMPPENKRRFDCECT